MVLNILNNLKNQSFTGVAYIKVSNQVHQHPWKIYFYLGKLIWAGGGCHSSRSWHRHLTQYSPQINLEQIDISTAENYKCQEYQTLRILRQRGLFTPEQANNLITSKLQEVFFDIFQQEKSQSLSLEAENIPLSSLLEQDLNQSIISVELGTIIDDAQKQWLAWSKSGFVSLSPNHAPHIKSQEKLKQEVSPVIYQNFIKLLDGRRTLRDLAAGMNKDLLLLTKSLFPYIHKGLVELVEVADVKLVKTNSNSQDNNSAQQKSGTQPLIACIDDSPQVCQIMNQIITRANYRFLGIQQPIQAVPSLISANPLMIFLDIGMPILNGYEVCTQIRRVSKLQDIPIIMLTGNDGVFDRVKAKVCGASDFLSKPIEPDKIIQTINKFSQSDVLVAR
ncbi:MAG: response regulator [Pleurocapsa sp.]